MSRDPGCRARQHLRSMPVAGSHRCVNIFPSAPRTVKERASQPPISRRHPVCTPVADMSTAPETHSVTPPTVKDPHSHIACDGRT